MRRLVCILIAALCPLLFSCENPLRYMDDIEPRGDLPNTQALPEGDAAFCAAVASTYGGLMGTQCFRGESQYFIHTADVQPAKIEKGLAENVPWSVDWEGAKKAGITVVYLFGGKKMDTAKAFLYPQIQPVPEDLVNTVYSRDDLHSIADAHLAILLEDVPKFSLREYVADEEDFIDRDGRVFAVRTINEGIFSCGKVRMGFFAHGSNLLTYTLCGNDTALETKLAPVFEDMMETTMIAR